MAEFRDEEEFEQSNPDNDEEMTAPEAAPERPPDAVKSQRILVGPCRSGSY